MIIRSDWGRVVCLAWAVFLPAIAVGQRTELGDALGERNAAMLPSQSALPPERLFAMASPAVVTLTVKDDDDREIGIGSGFVVGLEGEKSRYKGLPVYGSTIVTNYHVIRPAIEIDVSFADGKGGWVSEVIGEDESTDLAVLAVSSFAEPKSVLKLQKDVNAPIGTKVYAIGSPQGLSNTLSEGLVSGYRQRGQHEPWIQITAPISPGSSGGPLFSATGAVIGVTTAFLAESQNLNFAIPAREVSRLMNHTGEPRLVWEGASVDRTKRDAFLVARIALYAKYSAANGEKSPHQHEEQTFEAFREEQLRKGDQLALLLKGRDFSADGDRIEAISMLKRATQAEPGEYAYLAYWALASAIQANVKRIGDFEAAVAPLKQAKELNPDFGPTLYSLSETYRMLEMPPELLVAAESLIRLMPRCHEGYVLRGEAWALLGREEEAERDFEMACSLCPKNTMLLVRKGDAYRKLGKSQKALDAYEEAIGIDGGCALAYLNLGTELQRMGRCEEAIEAYKKALRLFDDDWIRGIVEPRIAECRGY